MGNAKPLLFAAGIAAIPIGFDLNNLSAVQATADISSEDAVPTGMAFNNNGSKVYMVGVQNRNIFEYNLSTAFDLNSISGDVSNRFIGSEDSIPNGISFNDDGTKIYMVGETNKSIYEYNMSVPYSLSNMSTVQATESVATGNTVPTGIAFNNDGSKVFVVAPSAWIFEHNLSTPFDISTISSIQVTKSVASEDGNPRGIAFNDTGTKIFMVGGSNDSIYEYNLTTAFDLSTLSAVQVTKSVGTEDNEPEAIAFNINGTKIFMIGAQNDLINEYNL